jgi:HAD superfamily hydrolase (TIGR01509 family)
MAMMLRAVIFDIDGTLVDTNAAHVEAWREAFAAHGYNIPRERILPEVGKGGDQLVPALLGKDGDRRDGEAVRRLHGEIFHRIAQQQHFCVFPGVKELLAELYRRGLCTALATSSKQDQLELVEKSADLKLRSLVDVVVTSDSAGASKPAPDIVLATLKKLDLPAESCLLVGDTAHDAEAARRAGVPCLGVLCGGCSSEEALRFAGVRSVWRDPADLLAHLDEALASGSS